MDRSGATSGIPLMIVNRLLSGRLEEIIKSISVIKLIGEKCSFVKPNDDLSELAKKY